MTELHTAFQRIFLIDIAEDALRQVALILVLMGFGQTLEDGMIIRHLIKISHAEMLNTFFPFGDEEHGYPSPAALTIVQQPLDSLPVLRNFIAFGFLIDELKMLKVLFADLADTLPFLWEHKFIVFTFCFFVAWLCPRRRLTREDNGAV